LQALTDLQYEDSEIDMPIGLFTRVHVTPLCGLAGPKGIIGILDVTKSFLHPDRVKAGLIWFEKGWIEYTFPNNIPLGRIPEQLELSFEACSEAPDYNPDWPSDITVWINGKKIGVWTSPGDYGGVRGRLTPEWWDLSSTQYGLLKTWSITDKGTYLDGTLVSNVTLGDLSIAHDSPFVVRIGIDEESRNIRGLNLFGETYGNHAQGIRLKTISRIIESDTKKESTSF
jgi:predicted transcriptional regulator